MKKRMTALGVVSALMIAGCASDYSRFYEAAPAPLAAMTEPFAGEPTVVVGSGNFNADMLEMYVQGYGPIGQSAFEGPQRAAAGAVQQAKKIGASHVVMSAQYARTVSGAVPITTYNTTTAVTNGSASVYSGGRSAYGEYSGTTTVTTPQTNYIPYSIARYDQVAVYYAPIKKQGMGVWMHPPSAEEARESGTNKGAIVERVRRGSPAFRADVLPGDHIVAVNGRDPYTPGVLDTLRAETQATLLIRRKGEEFTKVVALDW